MKRSPQYPIAAVLAALFMGFAQAAPLAAYHETPSAGSVESGIGLIRGWACDAASIEAVIDGALHWTLAYGTSREDTRSVCGDSNNGYGMVVNWNNFPEGEHRLQIHADGALLADLSFWVVPIGEGFLRGLQRDVEVPDFPAVGDRLRLSWSQAHQNFVPSAFSPGNDGGKVFSDILLTVDLASHSAVAAYHFISPAPAELELETGNLAIRSVNLNGDPTPFTSAAGLLRVTPPVGTEVMTVNYDLAADSALFDDGAASYTWPTDCAQIYPCLTEPAAGARYRLHLEGVPEGLTAVYPALLPENAPPYQLAWAIGDYRYLQLGVTEAGTRVGLWSLPGQRETGLQGTGGLVQAVDYLEQRLGPYAYGRDIAVVETDGPGFSGGTLESHPYLHVAPRHLVDPVISIHETIHGWFGNAVRLACWEDFVLSEGVTSYLTAVTVGAVFGPEREQELWQQYRSDLLAALFGDDIIVWPEGCGVVDVLDLYVITTYYKGAFFLRAVEQQVGRAALLDALAVFYRENKGQAARFGQLLDAIESATGFAPYADAQRWLRQTGIPSG